MQLLLVPRVTAQVPPPPWFFKPQQQAPPPLGFAPWALTVGESVSWRDANGHPVLGIVEAPPAPYLRVREYGGEPELVALHAVSQPGVEPPPAPPAAPQQWEPKVGDKVTWTSPNGTEVGVVTRDNVAGGRCLVRPADGRIPVRVDTRLLRPDQRATQTWLPAPGDKVEWNDGDSIAYGVVEPTGWDQQPLPEGFVRVGQEGSPFTTSQAIRVLRPDMRPPDNEKAPEYVRAVLEGNIRAFSHLIERRNKAVAQRQVRLNRRALKRLVKYVHGLSVCEVDDCTTVLSANSTNSCKAHGGSPAVEQ
jgi:hypothetical protein